MASEVKLFVVIGSGMNCYVVLVLEQKSFPVCQICNDLEHETFYLDSFNHKYNS